MVTHMAPKDRATEYLFVSSDTMAQSRATAKANAESQRLEILFRRRLEDGDRPTEEEARWLTVLIHVLTILSPSLRTLAVHGSIPRVDTLLPICLPNLIELTVHTPIIRLLPDDDTCGRAKNQE
ncbi:hypothetical protein ONZ45_g11323 [Pleurotus djamor]|nr:hypothetical protein ONZ45_g11323 [Pleurotus djamor]